MTAMYEKISTENKINDEQSQNCSFVKKTKMLFYMKNS